MLKEDNIFIYFAGMDGTGKSTHIEKILKKFSVEGRAYKYIWLRRPYLFSLVILAYCRLTGLTKITFCDGRKHGQWQFYRSRFVSAVFPWVQLIDAAIISIFKVHLPLMLGKTVVCDRFVYDTLVDTMLAIKDYELFQKKLGRLFLKLIPSKGISVFLDCDEATIQERKLETKYDTELNIRRKLYLTIARSFNLPVVNTSQSIDYVEEQIIHVFFSENDLATGGLKP